MKMAEKKVENGEKVEKKVENGKKVEKKGNRSDWIVKVVEEKIKRAGITLEEIESLKQITEELRELNAKMQEILSQRDTLREAAHYILDKIDSDTRKLLEFLGVIDFKEIMEAVYPSGGKRRATGQRTRRGNGLTGKTIVYQDTEYKQATYFMRKHGITGGLEGLKEWAESQGLTVRVEDDTIYIE